MPSGHWELLEPGHGDVWRWRLTPAVASKQVQSARRRASGAAFFLAIVKWRERSSSATGRIRRGELAVCRSRKRDALVAQKDFLQKATKETKSERPLTADHRPAAVACAKAADEKA